MKSGPRAALEARLRAALASDPGGETLRHGGHRVTRSELAERAQSWAERIREAGAPASLPLAVLLPKGPELVAALLGVFFSGRTWLWLDAAGEGVGSAEALMEAFRCGACITAEGVLHLRASPETDPPAPVAFALVRTSGTTGPPRGVLQHPEAVMDHAVHLARATGIGPGSRLSWLAPPGSAAAHSHLFTSLMFGATLCPFDPVAEGLDRMEAWLRECRVTHLHITPSLLRAWLEGLHDGTALPDLAVVKLGGEPARGADVRLLRRKLAPKPALFNGLGLSEAGGNIALGRIDLEEDPPVLLPVGRPVPGLDLSLRGVSGMRRWFSTKGPGEIVVHGRPLSLGHWPRSGAGTLIQVRKPVTRLRTGDRGNWMDGLLVHLGRLDRAVVERGRLTDLAAVEAEAAEFEPVRHAVALPEATGEGYQLALVIDPDTPGLRRSLRRALRCRLPHAPRRVAFFEALPLARSGKPDAAALLRGWPALSIPATVFRPQEQLLRQAWMEVLGHDEFGPEDTFFEVGGDSLQAMRLLVRIELSLGRRMDMAVFIRNPTVRDLAAVVEGPGEIGSARRTGAADAFHMEWVELAAGREDDPVFVFPGGWSSDGELWLVAALLAGLPPGRRVLAARTRLHYAWSAPPADAEAVLGPLRAAVLAAHAPALVGLCLGVPLLLALAAARNAAGAATGPVILMDPPPPEAGTASRQVPLRVARFYEVLRALPQPGPTEPCADHVICAGNDPGRAAGEALWRPRLRPGGTFHRQPGTHETFVREHQAGVAALLVRLLGGACPAEKKDCPAPPGA